MSTASLGWSVNDREVLASFQKMQGELDKQKQKIVQLEGATKKASDTWASGLRTVSREQERIREGQEKWAAGLANINKGQQISNNLLSEGITKIAGTVAGMFAVDKAVGVLVENYQDWIDRSEELRVKHSEIHKAVIGTLSASGQLARAGEFEEAAKSITGATPEQFRAAFGGIQQAAPGLGFERQMELARQAAPLGATGADMQQFGSALGDMAEAEPGKTAKELVDMATSLRALSGEKFGEFSGDRTQRVIAEMKSAGMQGERAMGLMIAGRQANVDPRTMEQLALAMASQETQKKATRGHKLTADDKLKNEFLAIKSPEARLAQLQNRPDMARAVLGDGYDTKLGLIKPGEISAAAEALSRPGAAGAAIAAMPESRAGAVTQMQQFLAEQETNTSAARVAAEREEVVQAWDRFKKIQGVDAAGRSVEAFGIRMAADPEQEALRQARLERRQMAQQVERGTSPKEALDRYDRMIQLLENLDRKSDKPGVKATNKNLEPAD